MHDLPDDPAEDALHYVYDNRVRFAETDAQGVVFSRLSRPSASGLDPESEGRTLR
jgi:hypothetical protein